MKAATKIAILAITGAVLIPITANADTATLFPTDDATVWQQNPNDNYGSEPSLAVGWSNYWLNTLIKFDLSSFTGDTINSADLRLYVYDAIGDFPTDNIRIARNDAYWDEDTVTWDNKPGFAEYTPISAPSSYDWWVIDVTDWVQDIVDGADPNYGFQIFKNDTSPTAVFWMRSKESSPDPELVLDYSPSAVVETSWGAIKAKLE